jgi:hypothetical protein
MYFRYEGCLYANRTRKLAELTSSILAEKTLIRRRLNLKGYLMLDLSIKASMLVTRALSLSQSLIKPMLDLLILSA